jgi:hypothetical protein
MYFFGGFMANPYQSATQSQLSNKLLEYLRKEHDKSSIDYLEPLIPLQGGAGGSLLSFKLKNPPSKLTDKLILRFSNAIKLEGTVQKQLKKMAIQYLRSTISAQIITSWVYRSSLETL